MEKSNSMKERGMPLLLSSADLPKFRMQFFLNNGGL